MNIGSDGSVIFGGFEGNLLSIAPSGLITFPEGARQVFNPNGVQAIGETRIIIRAGIYTPILTNVANISASTAYSCQFMQVGNTVTISGKVDVDPALTATSTQLGISLPLFSNLGAAGNCAGTAFASGIAGQGAAILGDVTNNRAQMQWVAGDISNQPMYFSFTYRIGLLTGLLAHWRLDEVSGGRMDSSGRSNHLTDNNTVAQAAGKIGDAAAFVTADSEYLSIASNPDLTFDADNVTFACWVYLNSKTNSMTILSKDDGSNTEYSLIYNQSLDRFVFQGGSESVVANNFGSPSTGTWYFIECYEDVAGELLGIRVNNGTANETATGGLFISAGTAQFRIGARNSGAPLYFDGRIDSVSIWDRLLISGERSRLYGAGNGIDYPF